MKFSTEQLINFWAFATMGALIFSAISIFFFRYYSGKKNEKNFNQIGTQITSEVNKAINEIDTTKEALKLKLSTEVEVLIDELKNNAKSANIALENLKDETTSLVKDVKEELTELKVETTKTLNEIKNPIGTIFRLSSFKFKIPRENMLDLDNHLTETGELEQTINMLRNDNVKMGSITIKNESIPKEIHETFKKFKWLKLRVVQKVAEDINTSNQLISIQFDSSPSYNIKLSQEVNSEYVLGDFIWSIGNDEIISSFVRKTKEIETRDDLCNKLVLIETEFEDYHYSNKPFDLEVSRLYITDNHLNTYQFIPLNNIGMSLFPESIKHLETDKAVLMMGILQCND